MLWRAVWYCWQKPLFTHENSCTSAMDISLPIEFARTVHNFMFVASCLENVNSLPLLPFKPMLMRC